MSLARSIGMVLGIATLALACACGEEGGPEPFGVRGAADGFGEEVLPVESCNRGALVVEPSTERAGELVATVSDQGVVDWFVAQSELTSVATVEYSGVSREVTVQHELPWMVSVEARSYGRALVVRDLRASGDGYATSGPGGVTIRPEGEGLRLTISGSTMPSSHSVVYYEVGQWLFEDCGGGECQPVLCALYCENGFERDEYGCEVCRCAEPQNGGGECQPVLCELYCENGFERDEYGCEVCRCAEPPYLWTCSELEYDLFMECLDEGTPNAECIEGPQRDLWMASVEACCALEPERHFCDLIPQPAECPPVLCALYCENGFERDEYGCEVCRCL